MSRSLGVMMPAGGRCLRLAVRGLATPVKLKAVSGDTKSQGAVKAAKQANTLRRRRKFDPSDNPFLANALGGGMSAADNQIKSFMRDGGFDKLQGAGKPLPERHVAPWVSRDEQVMNDIVDRLSSERDGLNEEDKAVYKKSAVRSEVAARMRNRGAK